MTVQLMMMHHNTKFDNKMFGGLEDIIWTNIDMLTLCCDLDLGGSNPIFQKDTPAYDAMLSKQVWLQV